jgi:hypothetical protein
MAEHLTKNKDVKKALALAARPTENWIELSELLADLVAKDRLFRKQFEQQSELDERTVFYFLKFGRQLRGLDLPKDRLKKIGWTKWEILSPRITRANADRLMMLAEQKTAHELKAELRGAGYKQKPRSMNLKFDREAYEKVEQALLKHGARRSRGGRGSGLEGKEQAFLAIIEKVSPRQKKGD